MNESDKRHEDDVTPVTPSTPEVETAPLEEVVTVVEEKVEGGTEAIVETKEVVAASEEMSEVKEVAGEGISEKTVAVAAATTPVAGLLKKFGPKWKVIVGSVVVVLVLLAGLVYVMEKQGKISTGFFDGIDKMVATRTAVATVNDGKISRYDLDISMSQITAGAAQQGADLTDATVVAEIQTQALDMLINTELLKQEAGNRGIAITDEDVQKRYETLKTDVGGEEALMERMKEFNIDTKTLRRDIKNELTIQALLDTVFTEKKIEVTEEEVLEMYAAAGGEEAGLPAIAEVREQIETQVRTSKEQEVVTGFVDELRKGAAIEILI